MSTAEMGGRVAYFQEGIVHGKERLGTISGMVISYAQLHCICVSTPIESLATFSYCDILLYHLQLLHSLSCVHGLVQLMLHMHKIFLKCTNTCCKAALQLVIFLCMCEII